MTILELLPSPRQSPNKGSPRGSDKTEDEFDDPGLDTPQDSEEEKHHVEINDEVPEEEHEKLKKASKSSIREVRDRIHRFRNQCGRVVNDSRVQMFIIVLISINAIMMGIGTFDFVTGNPRVDHAFELTDKIFLVIFTIELGMQFIYYDLRLFLDGWLCFDFIIITLSWSFASIQIIRAFRIFRALRLITRVKVMKNLVLALFNVMPRMAAISLLLFLIFYIFAVMFTQLFKDLYHDGETSADYFSRLDSSFFTLFQIMTLDAWAAIAREVMVVFSWAWLPFISFVIISGFIVVNLIIAVICDAIAALHADDKAKLHGQYHETDDEDSVPVQVDVREQLQTLEGQVEELTRVQEQTMHTLQYLTRHLQSKRVEVTTTQNARQ